MSALFNLIAKIYMVNTAFTSFKTLMKVKNYIQIVWNTVNWRTLTGRKFRVRLCIIGRAVWKLAAPLLPPTPPPVLVVSVTFAAIKMIKEEQINFRAQFECVRVKIERTLLPRTVQWSATKWPPSREKFTGRRTAAHCWHCVELKRNKNNKIKTQ